ELTVHTPDLDDVFFALTDTTGIPTQPAPSQQPSPSKETVR
ncbi:ABC transporter, partial [Streptomyces sp. NPDC002306]